MRDLQIVTEFCKHVKHSGRVAQSVEQRIENPRVGSSILPPATSISKPHSDVRLFHFVADVARM